MAEVNVDIIGEDHMREACQKKAGHLREAEMEMEVGIESSSSISSLIRIRPTRTTTLPMRTSK